MPGARPTAPEARPAPAAPEARSAPEARPAADRPSPAPAAPAAPAPTGPPFERVRQAAVAEGSPSPATVVTEEPPPAPAPSSAPDPVTEPSTAARLAAQLAPSLASLPVMNLRGVTLTPPTPPFFDAEAPFRWQVSLPSSLGRTVTIQVGDGEIDLGGTVVAVDEIADARFKLDVEAALFRRAASARMTVTLALKSGSTVRVSARNAASSRRATAIVETLTYLWTMLGDSAGEDERQMMIGKVDRGSEVQVGRLRLTSIGIAHKREPIARWGTIGTPRREGLDVVIPRSDGSPIVVPLTADDAYQLPALVPALRKRFS